MPASKLLLHEPGDAFICRDFVEATTWQNELGQRSGNGHGLPCEVH
jgi:hypothetical protein